MRIKKNSQRLAHGLRKGYVDAGSLSDPTLESHLGMRERYERQSEGEHHDGAQEQNQEAGA